MNAAAVFLPLLLASLFLIAAVHEELTHPRHSTRLARTPLPLAAVCADPGAIVALNAEDFDRLYASPIATCAKGADRL
jgi:hypothetical protein